MKKGVSNTVLIVIIAMALIIGLLLGLLIGRDYKRADEVRNEGITQETSVQEKTEESSAQQHEEAVEESSNEESTVGISEYKDVEISIDSNDPWPRTYEDKEMKCCQYNITVKNKGEQTIPEHWQASIVFDKSVKIADGWNGTFELDDEEKTIGFTAGDYQAISPGESKQITFQVCFDEKPAAPEVKIKF